MRKTLGVSIIVKNESEVIEKCLESVKDADKIYICDTGSTDNTVELCKKYTSHVYTDYVWQDDFSAARNHCLEKCKTDYILIIDADEELAVPIEKIKGLINSYDFLKYMGATFEVQTNIERLHSVRLFKNQKSIRWEGAIHNRLKWSEGDLKSRCLKTAFEINSGFSPAHLLDPDRTMRILLKGIEKEPENTRLMYYLGREYLNKQDPDNALEWLIKYYKICYFKDWTNELADACYLIALIYVDKKDARMAMMYAVISVLVMPTFKDPMVLLSELFKLPPQYPLASAYWLDLASRANNANVLFQRGIKK